MKAKHVIIYLLLVIVTSSCRHSKLPATGNNNDD